MDRKKIISEFDEIFVFERNIKNHIKTNENFINLMKPFYNWKIIEYFV